MPPTPPPRKRLGEILLGAGAIDETRLQAALAEQRKWGGHLGRTLVDLGFVDEETIALALARRLGLPHIDLSASPPQHAATRLVPVGVCERYGLVPVTVDPERKFLRVAASDPTNVEALREVAFRTGMRVEPMVAAPSHVDRAVRALYYGEGLEETAPTSLPGDAVVPGSSSDMWPGLSTIDLSDQKDPLLERIERIERLLEGELRSLRVLVEMLVEKGVIDQPTFQARSRSR